MINTLLLIALGFVAGVTLARLLARPQKRPHLNLEGFICSLNEDMRQDILREAAEEGNFFRALGKAVFDEETRRREDIEAKIGAWHNSDYSGSLHEYLGMTEAELDAFAKYAERVHSGDPD